MKKNLIFLAEFQNNSGGMMQSLTTLIEGLSYINQYDITLISPKGSEISQYPFHNIHNLTTSYSSWNISRKSIFRTFLISFEIWNIIKDKRHNATFISNNIGSSIIISFMPCLRIKEIFVCRGGNFKSSGLGGYFIRLKIKMRRLQHIVATSSHLKKNIETLSFPSKRITIIYNGLPLPERDYTKRELDKSILKISTVGYFSEGKNQILGIRLIKRLRQNGINAHLNLYGMAGSDSDKEYLKFLKDEIFQLSIQEYIHFKGFIKGEQLYKDTDILISFSKSEGFGRTLVEFMLRKIITIAYKGAGGPVDITENGKYGILVDNNNVDDYFNAIQDILSNKAKISEMVDKAYIHAKENFNIDKMIYNYNNLFKLFA